MNDDVRAKLNMVGHLEGRLGGFGIEFAIQRAGATTEEEIAVVKTAYIDGGTEQFILELRANLRFGTFERKQALLDAMGQLLYEYGEATPPEELYKEHRRTS